MYHFPLQTSHVYTTDVFTLLVPGPVISLSTTPYPTTLQLTWSAPLLPNGVIIVYEVSHQLQRGMELGRENTTGVHITHTLTGLRPQTTYTATVRAYTIAGSGKERSVTETTEAIREYFNALQQCYVCLIFSCYPQLQYKMLWLMSSVVHQSECLGLQSKLQRSLATECSTVLPIPQARRGK